MANTPVQSGEKTVDPMFFIPDGVVGMEYSPAKTSAGTSDSSDTTAVAAEGEDPGDVVASDAFGPANTVDILDTPQILSVISQTVRRSPGGNNVIDVVMEVENVAGAAGYEFRVAKA